MAQEQVGYKLYHARDLIQSFGGPGQVAALPQVIQLTDGTIVMSPEVGVDYFGHKLMPWFEEAPPQRIFASQVWMRRFTRAEYGTIKNSPDLSVHSFWDLMMANGEVDVLSAEATAGRDYWIEIGLLTGERAYEIWDTVPPSLPPYVPPEPPPEVPPEG